MLLRDAGHGGTFGVMKETHDLAIKLEDQQQDK